jgi:CDP-glycerol glycerophosphotransferase
MAPRVSVVVPVYNVAPYLEACLTSLARQTLADLEVVMVDDGSTDGSPAIAERFARQDARFQLVRQANAGLGAARNTGAAHASGEFLAFVDSDDIVPRDAYELLLGALDRTGSDFACGNVRRLTPFGTAPALFLGNAFDRTRLRTHITRHPRLLLDRTAWNKLFRRSFWDLHGFRFPEGVLYEDIPVTLPAHYVASSVDALEETVYLWRMREGEALSITQRRTDPKALRDRVAAVDFVSRFLAAKRLNLSKWLYDRTVVGQDLNYFVSVLPAADEAYRRLFLALANDFLDRADAGALEQPLAIDRVRWQLVRRGALEELLEVLRFEDEELVNRPPLRRRGRWYGDYPYRDDERLRIPRHTARLFRELSAIARVENMRWEAGSLRISGYAYIDFLGAPEPDSQRVALAARRTGWPPVRARFETETRYRPDLGAVTAQEVASLDYAGFVATLPVSELRRAGGGWREGAWKLGIVVRGHGLVRRNARLEAAPLHPALPAEYWPTEDTRLQVALTAGGELRLNVERRRARVRSCVVDARVVQLEGTLESVDAASLKLVVGGVGPQAPLTYPVHVDRGQKRRAFIASLPVPDLIREHTASAEADGAVRPGDLVTRPLYLRGGGSSIPLTMDDVRAGETSLDGLGVAIEPDLRGRATVVEGIPRPLLTRLEWSDERTVSVEGNFRGRGTEWELVLSARRRAESVAVQLDVDGDGRFRTELTPAAISRFGAARPLGEGEWEILVRHREHPRQSTARLSVESDCMRSLPASSIVGGKRFHLGMSTEGTPLLAVERNLGDDERGGLAQRRLRQDFYPAKRRVDLRDAVLYTSFDGREYSDSPRAIHQELVRRDAPLEHLWVVRDEAFSVPEGVTPIRELSREYYEAFARARYVVSNDYWPVWFRRRPDQVCVQTWHGVPLKRVGNHLVDRPRAFRQHRRVRAQQAENWQFVVSPGPFATRLLRQSFPAQQVIETGLPRTDLLLAPDRERLAHEVKTRLGLRGERVILYAPTYRDDLGYGLGHRRLQLRDIRTWDADFGYRDTYRIGPLLDLAALRSGLGKDHAILVRRHPSVADPLPGRWDAVARDVSDYGDVMDLLLIADVLVTDYSSLAFDFATTGRPLIFYTPDLEAYRDHVRGLNFDWDQIAPGPLLRTTDEVAEALLNPEEVVSEHGARYEAFVNSYCSLNDGKAAARVVDEVFGKP